MNVQQKENKMKEVKERSKGKWEQRGRKDLGGIERRKRQGSKEGGNKEVRDRKGRKENKQQGETDKKEAK